MVAFYSTGAEIELRVDTVELTSSTPEERVRIRLTLPLFSDDQANENHNPKF
jgi:uncharacterized beta-barrel protein YwiB (DUF1934 family)